MVIDLLVWSALAAGVAAIGLAGLVLWIIGQLAHDEP
jgi:hypothetical protein